MTSLTIIAAAQLALVAFLIWERRRATPDLNSLVALVDRLCQRLQAPGAAILEHDEAVRALSDEQYAPPALVPDDDQAFWESRDKLAERLMEQETGHGGD